MFCFKCGRQLPENSRFCTACGASLAEPQPVSGNTYVQGTVQPLPMKWHKFLIYFSLFAGAVVSFVVGLGFLTGQIYEFLNEDSSAERMYDFWGNDLKNIDMIFGILFILVAVFAIVTRFRLASFKKDGPVMLSVFFVLNIIIPIAYLIAIASLTSVEIDYTSITGSFTQFAFFLANYTYYKKRAHLFN